EPIVQRHRRVGGADHAGDTKSAGHGDGDVAAAKDVGARSHGAHSGRIMTPGPLTRLTAKISATKMPSAKAMAMERARRRRCCSAVSTIPGSVGRWSMTRLMPIRARVECQHA